MVAAQALVNKDVGECEVVGGVPAKVIAKRNPDALKYTRRLPPAVRLMTTPEDCRPVSVGRD